MTKQEEVREEVLSNTSNNKMLLLPTSFGKTKLALDLMIQVLIEKGTSNILIVVPTLILIDNWKTEIIKWGYEKYLPNIEFITYKSYAKKFSNIVYDLTIFDEGHHYTERCADNWEGHKTSKVIVLTATITNDAKYRYTSIYGSFYIKKITVAEAIASKVLPAPRILLIPLKLNCKDKTQNIIKNPNKSKTVIMEYKDRFKAYKIKDKRVVIPCTEYQYNEELDNNISYLSRFTNNPTIKNVYLFKSNIRLKWLSTIKINYTKKILEKVKDSRTLTFCSDIEQSNILGKYAITSKNSNFEDILDKFNNGDINHITACNMLNEGCNLVNCQVGIYNVINSSYIRTVQKIGRFLRHKHPILIIPYFKGTREEHLIDKMFEEYDNKLIEVLDNINNLTI